MQMSTPKQSKFFNYQLHSPSPTTNGDTNGMQNSPWNNSLTTIGDESGSPVSSCGGSPTDCDLNKSFTKSDTKYSGQDLKSESNSKRGRPRSEALTSLMIQGSTSPSAIKCKFCNRVFPRDKSLQAHLRTHTGERPYTCDYPGCTRAFTQSGQLKTHQRLHTGERPFVCSANNCQMRFTHANRHCPDHPYDTLRRCDDDFVIQPMPEEQSTEILKWLQKYREERQQQMHLQNSSMSSPSTTTTPTTRKTPSKRSSSIKVNDENKRRFKRFHQTLAKEKVFGSPVLGNNVQQECLNLPLDKSNFSDNHPISEESPLPNYSHYNNQIQKPFQQSQSQSQKSVRKGLMCELDMNAGRGGIVTSSPFQNLVGYSRTYQTMTARPCTKDENSYADNILSSPLSSGKFGKSHTPKVISWKEPVENDDDYLSDTGNDRAPPVEFDSHPHEPDSENFSSEKNIPQQQIYSLENSSEESPKQLLNPKKKWLREAWNDDLGTKPLEPYANNLFPESHWQMGGYRTPTAENDNPNQMRPTVLMVASRDKTRPMLENAPNDYESTQIQPPRSYGISQQYYEDVDGSRYNYSEKDQVARDFQRFEESVTSQNYTSFDSTSKRDQAEPSYFNNGRTMSILEISPELIRSVKLKEQLMTNSNPGGPMAVQKNIMSTADSRTYTQQQYYDKVNMTESRSYAHSRSLSHPEAAHFEDNFITNKIRSPSAPASTNFIEASHLQGPQVEKKLEYLQEIESFPQTGNPSVPDGYNRELFGALALIQLATDDLAVDYSLNKNHPDNYSNAIISEDDTALTEEEYANQSSEENFP